MGGQGDKEMRERPGAPVGVRAADLVKGQGLVPTAHSQQLEGLIPGRVPAHRPHGRLPGDGELLLTRLVPDGDQTREHADGEELRGGKKQNEQHTRLRDAG